MSANNMLKRIVLASLVTWSCLQNIAVAGQMSFDEEFSGQVRSSSLDLFPESASAYHYQPLSSLSEHHLSGSCMPSQCGDTQTNGYIAFDVSSLGFIAETATLQLDLSGGSVLGPPGLSGLLIYMAGAAVLQDLQSLEEGTVSIATANSFARQLEEKPSVAFARFNDIARGGVIDFTLPTAAINQINTSGGVTGFGLRLATFVDGNLFFNGPSRLIVTGASVPVSGTLPLILLGLILLLGRPKRLRLH